MSQDARTTATPALRIIPREQHVISRKNISKAALRVLYRLNEAGYDAFLVGGAVRDLLLGGHPKDFDVATNATPDEVKAVQRELGVNEAGHLVEATLASIARGLRECGVRKFVVAGGETSGAVVAALGLSRARALPAGALGGGFCVAEGPAGPVSLYLKSGKLGADDILERALAFMTPDSA